MCHNTSVTLRVRLRPGQSIFEQVVFAAKKAFLGGDYSQGQLFPSVRVLASELKIHPNTAHKIIQHLVQERWLEVRPGIGTIVARPPDARPGDKRRLLQQEVEQLVVEAQRVGLQLRDLVEAVSERWSDIDRSREAKR